MNVINVHGEKVKIKVLEFSTIIVIKYCIIIILLLVLIIINALCNYYISNRVLLEEKL